MWWMGLIQAGVGIAQTAIAASKKTTPMKEYSATPESKLAGQMALETAKQGASQAERAQFGQQLARQQTGFEQMFRNSGMQGVGNAVSSILGADSINRFAVDNANLMRQGRSDYANWAQSMQSISDKNVAQNNQLALAESQAQGAAVQAGIGNMIGGVNSSSNAAMTGKSIDMYGKIAANANSDMGTGGGGIPPVFGSNALQIGGYNQGQSFQSNIPSGNNNLQIGQGFYGSNPGLFSGQGGGGMVNPSNWMNQGNWWEKPISGQ